MVNCGRQKKKATFPPLLLLQQQQPHTHGEEDSLLLCSRPSIPTHTTTHEKMPCVFPLPRSLPFPYCFTISPEPTLFSGHLLLRANTRTRQVQRLNLCACWAPPAPLSSFKATKYTTTSQTHFILTRAFGWSCLFAWSIPSPAFCLYSAPPRLIPPLT